MEYMENNYTKFKFENAKISTSSNKWKKSTIGNIKCDWNIST